MKRILSPLLALSLLVGCGQSPQVPFDARLNLKNNLTAALSNIADEGESIKALQAAIHAALESLSQESEILKELERFIKAGLSEIIPSRHMVDAIVTNALEHEVAKAVFNPQNVVASTADEITYRLNPSVCPALSRLVGGEADMGAQMLGGMCEMFLTKNKLDLTVKLTGEKSVDLNFSFNDQFVVGLAVGENGIGLKFSLDGIKPFVESLMQMLGPNAAIPIGPTFFQGFDTLTGEFSLGLQFASKDKPSPCKNGEKICLVANVDKDFALALKGEDKFNLKIGSSPAATPTLTVTCPSDGDFTGAFNIGVIEGNFSNRRAGNNDQLFIEALSFNVRVPKTDYREPTVLLFENIKTGARLSFAEFDNQRITVKLTNDGKEIAKIKAVDLWNGSTPTITASPFSLSVTHTDKTEKDCKIVQKFTLKTDADATTAIFGDSRDRRHSRSEGCSLQNSEAYNFFKSATIKSDPEVCSKGHLQVTEGKLTVKYTGQVNEESEESMSHTVDNGQCLGY